MGAFAPIQFERIEDIYYCPTKYLLGSKLTIKNKKIGELILIQITYGTTLIPFNMPPAQHRATPACSLPVKKKGIATIQYPFAKVTSRLRLFTTKTI